MTCRASCTDSHASACHASLGILVIKGRYGTVGVEQQGRLTSQCGGKGLLQSLEMPHQQPAYMRKFYLNCNMDSLVCKQ